MDQELKCLYGNEISGYCQRKRRIGFFCYYHKCQHNACYNPVVHDDVFIRLCQKHLYDPLIKNKCKNCCKEYIGANYYPSTFNNKTFVHSIMIFSEFCQDCRCGFVEKYDNPQGIECTNEKESCPKHR